jgi:hypothetical protein
MRKFNSFGEFAAFMQTRIEAVPAAARHGLGEAAKIIEAEAKAEIGHYQGAAGPFKAWEPLSPATLNGFVHENGTVIPGREGDDPLLRTGGLRDSIEHQVSGYVAVVGSNDPKAVWQELGTSNAVYPIPPRSFLGGAAVRKGPEAVVEIAEAVVSVLADKL